MSIALLSRWMTRLNGVFLRNIVATVNLDCRLDLKTIALHARNAEYNPKVLTTVDYSCLENLLNSNSASPL